MVALATMRMHARHRPDAVTGVAIAAVLVVVTSILAFMHAGSVWRMGWWRSAHSDAIPSIALVTLSKRVQSTMRQEGDQQFAEFESMMPEELATLGCVQSTKRAYAESRGYQYFEDEDMPPDSEMLPMYPHMDTKIGRFRKLRFLLWLMHHRRDIEWFMWMDGDAMITNADVTVEERLETFKSVFTDAHGGTQDQLTLIISQDTDHWNTGVFLIRNTARGRHMLHVAYGELVDVHHIWADQQALIVALHAAGRRAMFSKLVMALPSRYMHYLQSYHSSKIIQLLSIGMATPDRLPVGWKPDHWILHLVDSTWTDRGYLLSDLHLC